MRNAPARRKLTRTRTACRLLAVTTYTDVPGSDVRARYFRIRHRSAVDAFAGPSQDPKRGTDRTRREAFDGPRASPWLSNDTAAADVFAVNVACREPPGDPPADGPAGARRFVVPSTLRDDATATATEPRRDRRGASKRDRGARGNRKRRGTAYLKAQCHLRGKSHEDVGRSRSGHWWWAPRRERGGVRVIYGCRSPFRRRHIFAVAAGMLRFRGMSESRSELHELSRTSRLSLVDETTVDLGSL